MSATPISDVSVESCLDFADRCQGRSDVQSLIDEFRVRIKSFGFDASVCGGWAGIANHRVHRFYFNDWPQSWLDIYLARDFFSDDPFVAESRRRAALFAWTEVEEALSLTPRAREIRQAFENYGWREVVGVPIHGPAGYQGLVSMASMKSLALMPRECTLLQMMATAIHQRCRSELNFGAPASPLPALSEREIDCLKWAAVGKTDLEIGAILGISGATAHFHIEKAKRKLKTSRRTEAVTLLVLHGVI